MDLQMHRKSSWNSAMGQNEKSVNRNAMSAVLLNANQFSHKVDIVD